MIRTWCKYGTPEEPPSNPITNPIRFAIQFSAVITIDWDHILVSGSLKKARLYHHLLHTHAQNTHFFIFSHSMFVIICNHFTMIYIYIVYPIRISKQTTACYE